MITSLVGSQQRPEGWARLVSDRAARKDALNREELVERIACIARENDVVEALPGLRIWRTSRPSETLYGASRPSFCVIAQGAKEVYVGDKRYIYNAHQYLVATMELPITARIVEASQDSPYLAFVLDLDPGLVASVMAEAGMPVPADQGDARAVVVSALDADLLESALRLVRLIDAPDVSRVLLPLVKREIALRLLLGEQGDRLRHMPTLGANSHSIARAIELLREQFDRPLRIDGVAKEVGMSPSSFYHHFRAITGMTPLQFQKQIRLQEARQLMIAGSLDAASAGFRVGYSDPSHFSRDYRRRFGLPPATDAEHLRAAGGVLDA